MPEITELLDQAAPRNEGAAPLDAIVRRGRRRKAVRRGAAIGAPLAAVAVVASVLLTGDAPDAIVVDPPPIADEPAPTPDPTPSAPDTESTEPTPDEGDTSEAPETSGWVEPSGLVADLLVVEGGGDTADVVRMRADGSVDRQTVDAGVPNTAGLLPDRDGGFTWQPEEESADPAPVLHVDAEGRSTPLLVGDEPGSVRLVGWDLGLGRPLITEQRGNDIEDLMADLLSVPLDGSDAEVVRHAVGAWEVGVSHAAVLETALYGQYVEAMQNVVLDPPDADPQVRYEAGEITGEDVAGVGILEESWTGVALVTRMAGLEDAPAARLLLIDLVSGEITDEVGVPLAQGLEGDEAWPGTAARDVSVVDGHVLVNRSFDGEWVGPLLYDTEDDTWSGLEHADGGPVAGRAFLAPHADRGTRAEQAACITEDGDLRNAQPVAGEVSIYLPCKDEAQPWPVYRLPTGIEATGDVTADLTAALELLLEPVIEDDELIMRGYHVPADRGQAVLRSVAVEDGHAVVDLGFPDGVGTLDTAHAGAVWHHTLRGTVFQFDEVETLELRLDGSCEDYAAAFQGDGCAVLDRENAPWNIDHDAGA